MPNLFINIDQSFLCEVNQKAVGATSFIEALKTDPPNIEVNLRFLKSKSPSSCGFEITSESFVNGGLTSKQISENKFQVNISGVAKVKVYEMQINAWNDGDTLVIDTLSKDMSGFSPAISTEDTSFSWNGDKYLVAKAKLGMKKSDVI